MRLTLVCLLVLTCGVARARAEVAIGAHTVGGLVAATGAVGGGMVAGADIAFGSEGSTVAIVAEELWRLPDAYDDARERTLTVEYRAYLPAHGRGRGGFVGGGAGIRRLATRDDVSAFTLRGMDLRIEGGVALHRGRTADIHLRFALVYGVYTNGRRDDGTRIFVGGLDYFTAQMLLGIDISSRLSAV